MTNNATQPHSNSGALADEEGNYPYWRQNRTAFAASTFFGGLGFHLSFPYVPLMLLSLGVVDQLDRWMGFMLLAFYAAGFISNPLWGGLADHYGRKLMVLRATFGMGLSMLGIALAWSPLSFAILLVVCGFFNGSMAAANSLMVANTPGSRLGTSLSQVQTGNLLGQTLGPLAGLVIAAMVSSYHSMYAISGTLQLAAGVLALVFVREVKQIAPGKFRPHFIADLVSLMKTPGMAGVMMLCFVSSMLTAGNVPILSVHVVNLLAGTSASLGDQAFWIGAVAIGLSVSSLIALPFWGPVLNRKGPRFVVIISTIMAALTHIPLIFVDTPFHVMLARIGFGLSAIALQPALTWLLRENAPKGMDARAISYATSFQFMAMGLAPFIAGLIGPLFGLRAYFGLTVVITVIALALWLRTASAEGTEPK